MASSDSSTATLPLAPKKENVTPIGSKIAELNESRTELLSRIQGLKQDLQGWRSKLDTQVKIYRDIKQMSNFNYNHISDIKSFIDPGKVMKSCKKLIQELSELKKSLNVEVVQLRTEFQELKNTLQQQQEDVTASLRNLGLQDSPGDDAKEAQEPKVDAEDQEVPASVEEDIEKKDEN
ncbi:UVEAL AUTOANTIGEN WITH COILED-COIL/ANKYRIN [Salix koriyanagi]|uniref:UVEAL AUTOANTIGEN WITH COILED-COIL/ANKYRIN n=1 Tax=Salix koriyanagi TaxID=2511006 RepID=A0A9Q0WPL5_9ROSI|nr:UVEAL AUTOANTIGEN WITH COILED-COIL/ANKYRIN [Salix koriyanagi]